MCLLRPSGHCADCGKPGCTNDHRTAKCSPVQTRCATSANGTKRTYRVRSVVSAFGGKAEIICSHGVFPVLTLNGHRPIPHAKRESITWRGPCFAAKLTS